MATVATIGYGFTIGYASTSGGSYTTLAEVLECKLPVSTVDKIKIQSNTSPDLSGETISGWYNTEDAELKLIFAPTQTGSLYGLKAVPKFWKFTYPNGTSKELFYGFISSIGDMVPLKEAMTTEVKITPSGSNTFTS